MCLDKLFYDTFKILLLACLKSCISISGFVISKKRVSDSHHVLEMASVSGTPSTVARPGTGHKSHSTIPPFTHAIPDEQRLMNYLFRGYERSVRPVRNASTPVIIRMGLTLTQIFDMVSAHVCVSWCPCVCARVSWCPCVCARVSWCPCVCECVSGCAHALLLVRICVYLQIVNMFYIKHRLCMTTVKDRFLRYV